MKARVGKEMGREVGCRGVKNLFINIFPNDIFFLLETHAK
jgi:hypothetical protein